MAVSARAELPGGLARLRGRLNKPYYLFRPRQMLRRAWPSARQRSGPEFDQIVLPWELPLKYRAQDEMGRCISRRGIFDLVVCEALWRLSDPGELALDVGANIGHMTSALAARLGPTGTVVPFEPHPILFRELSENVARWAQFPATARVEPRELALGASSGKGQLTTTARFDSNMGLASMASRTEGGDAITTNEVTLARLDEVLPDVEIGVMKLDVEGYELQVLEGASKLLEQSRVRDIVFEELDPPPTPVMELLESFNFRIFSLDQRLWGPALGAPTAAAAARSLDDPSYLATVDPARALDRLRTRGWATLSAGPARRRWPL